MKVLYVYDALCGWCYGFSPVMKQFQETYNATVDVEVLSGGMITGGRIGPIGEVASYISWAYKDVENATGVKFGDSFLNKTLKNGKAIFTSIPPATALCVFKTLDTTRRSVQFAAMLQKAIYYDGLEPEDIDAYGKLAAEFGIDAHLFTSKMKDPLFKQMAEADFNKTQALNVTGFPTVFLVINNNYYKIGSGYIPFQKLEQNFLAVKK